MKEAIQKAIRGGGAESVLLDIYEQLRNAHTIIKQEILSHERYSELPNIVKAAIDGVHDTLYMAEYVVIKEDLEDKEVSRSLPYKSNKVKRWQK